MGSGEADERPLVGRLSLCARPRAVLQSNSCGSHVHAVRLSLANEITHLVITAWAFQLAANGLFAAAPVWGFNITPQDGHPHGFTMTLAGISAFYVALASSKSAFATALVRLSSGKIKALLYSVICVVWGYCIVLEVVSWLAICGQEQAQGFAKLPGSHCVKMETLISIHIGNSVCMIVTDLIFAYLPWRIVSKISISSREKRGVGASMSLVVLAVIICITRQVRTSI